MTPNVHVREKQLETQLQKKHSFRFLSFSGDFPHYALRLLIYTGLNFRGFCANPPIEILLLNLLKTKFFDLYLFLFFLKIQLVS